MRRRSPIFVAILLLASGCGSVVRPVPEPREEAPLIGPEADASGIAFTLMLSDRRFYEPFTIRRILVSQPSIRADLALALGRIGHPAGRVVLESLLEDRQPPVRRAAALALGLLGQEAASDSLLVAAGDIDREVGRLAVEALARLDRPLEESWLALSFVEPEERWRRLLPSLFRFRPDEIRALAPRALGEAPEELRPWIAYAVGRRAASGSADLLRALLPAEMPAVRAWAVRGLSVSGGREDLARLLPVAEGADAPSVIEALRTARSLVASGRAAPQAEWVPVIERLMGDARAGVRFEALQTAGAWLRNELLSAQLVARAREGSPWERELALLALAVGGDARARDLIAESMRSPSASRRAQAAEAASLLGLSRVLHNLFEDPEPRVRLAALGALLRREEAAEAAKRALQDPDPALQAAALEWLSENPVIGVERLREPLALAANRYMVHVGLNGVAALLGRAMAEPRERGVIVAMLEQIGQVWDYPVRRQAAVALGALDRPVPPRGEFETGLGIRDYRELVRRTRPPRFARLVTRHGVALLRLDCPAAPLTCENFMRLANQGFYDGLSFHRVVPGSVVLGGDPRGDGWGGPGYTIRDEPNLARFERGVLGMALSGPNTGGSQFFVSLSAQPHLDGEFTPFGAVVQGMETIDRIEQGDLIEEVVEVETPG